VTILYSIISERFWYDYSVVLKQVLLILLFYEMLWCNKTAALWRTL